MKVRNDRWFVYCNGITKSISFKNRLFLKMFRNSQKFPISMENWSGHFYHRSSDYSAGTSLTHSPNTFLMFHIFLLFSEQLPVRQLCKAISLFHSKPIWLWGCLKAKIIRFAANSSPNATALPPHHPSLNRNTVLLRKLLQQQKPTLPWLHSIGPRDFGSPGQKTEWRNQICICPSTLMFSPACILARSPPR